MKNIKRKIRKNRLPKKIHEILSNLLKGIYLRKQRRIIRKAYNKATSDTFYINIKNSGFLQKTVFVANTDKISQFKEEMSFRAFVSLKECLKKEKIYLSIVDDSFIKVEIK